MSSEADRLPSAAISDALLRQGKTPRMLPAELRGVTAHAPLAGPARPVQHAGSVDLLFEAVERLTPGDVVVVDNGGRTDEACIGDLFALECWLAGAAAIVVWGLHRDEDELQQIGLPVYSLGSYPCGPTEQRDAVPDALTRARVGSTVVAEGDVIVLDDDGGVVVASDDWEEVVSVARDIVATERQQANRMRTGISLREQLAFATYLKRRNQDPTYSFREHLRQLGGAIEA